MFSAVVSLVMFPMKSFVIFSVDSFRMSVSVSSGCSDIVGAFCVVLSRCLDCSVLLVGIFSLF